MQQDSLSILKLVLDASPVVQFVAGPLGHCLGDVLVHHHRQEFAAAARARSEAEGFEAKFCRAVTSARCTVRSKPRAATRA